MTQAPEPDPRLAQLIEIWHHACADFVALARSIPREQWDLPTDLEGWSVKDNVAHTAHLEAVLAGAPEETLEVDAAPHLTGLMNYYTEQGVLARRDRDMEELLTELEESVARRRAALQADPPSDGDAAPPKTPGDIGWNWRTLLTNRPVDVWMHEQDIRRAIGRPGGFDSPVAAHVMRTLGRALPMVVGKRLAPPPGTTVRLEVPEAGLGWTASVGDDGRAAKAADDVPTTVTVTLSPEDFVVLAGGRRPPTAADPRVVGDGDLGHRLLEVLAVTP
jgi:uncharacterized protein (TIGR03083 family)